MARRVLSTVLLLVSFVGCGGEIEGSAGRPAEPAPAPAPGPAPAATTLTVERDGVVHAGYTCALDDTISFTGHGALFVIADCRHPESPAVLELSFQIRREAGPAGYVGAWAPEDVSSPLSSVSLDAPGEFRPSYGFEAEGAVRIDADDRSARIVRGTLDVRLRKEATRVHGPFTLFYPPLPGGVQP